MASCRRSAAAAPLCTGGARGSVRRAGITLIEMLVVLLLIAMMAALVIPALLRRQDSGSGFPKLVANTRETAIRRGENLYLRIGASGEWRIDGATATGDGAPLQAGRVDPIPAPITLLVTSAGSCMPDVASTAAAASLRLDPLTCEIVDRPETRSRDSVP